MILRILGAVALLGVSFADPVAAQDRPAPVVELAGGWVGFPDDGTVNETLAGGAFRWYATPRISVGPELVYIKGSSHRHLIATGNVTFDLLQPSNTRPLTPFVVVGGGLFQTRQTFFSGPFTSNEGAFTAGGGVRAHLNERVFVGMDARLGWELHARLNATVGIAIVR